MTTSVYCPAFGEYVTWTEGDARALRAVSARCDEAFRQGRRASPDDLRERESLRFRRHIVRESEAGRGHAFPA